MCNYSNGYCSSTAIICRCKVVDSINLYFRMSYRCRLWTAVSSLHSPEHNRCKVQPRCFQDLEKLRKAQTTALFESALHRLPSYASDLHGFLCFRDQHH